MNLLNLVPFPSERGFLVGKTGSGKTTMAKAILPYYRDVLAIDPKITLGASQSRPDGWLRGFTLVRDPHRLPEAAKANPRIQYRPDIEFQSLEYYDRVYKWAFERGNTFVYTDEVFLVLEGQRMPDGFRACITSGRERRVGMLHAAQRPCSIPKIVYTESEHFYVFELMDDDDRTCVSKMTGRETRERPAQGHGFWYRGPRGRLRYMRLNL